MTTKIIPAVGSRVHVEGEEHGGTVEDSRASGDPVGLLFRVKLDNGERHWYESAVLTVQKSRD